MAAFLILSIQVLLLMSAASASHFTAGTVRIVPKERHLNGSYLVDLHFRQTYRHCQRYLDWSCMSGNCGSLQQSEFGVIDTSVNSAPFTNAWCEAEIVQTRYYTNDNPFSLRKASCCWIRNSNNLGSWNLFTYVDLRERSDNWQPNVSPNNAIMPFLRVPQNCPRSYHMMTVDPDGDQVICRHGTINQPQGFNLDEAKCVLHYTGTYSGTYGFQLVVEDFPRSIISLISTNGTKTKRFPLNASRKKRAIYTSSYNYYPTTTTTPGPTTTTAGPTTAGYTTPRRNHYPAPLSQIPLQFSVFVDSPAPSCTEGEYLPRFVYPTPSHGDHLNAQVNEEFEMRIKATAHYSQVGDIIFTGPLNSTKHKIALGEFYIRWTPTVDQLRDQVPICFVAEAAFGRQQYQSEMRCVWVLVDHAKAHVICDETKMTVELEKAAFKGLDENHLRLNDGSNTACRLHSNSTHVIGIIPLNACGTTIMEDDENLMFANEVSTFEDIRDIVTRKHLLEVQFACGYPKRGNVSLGFTVHRENTTISEKGFGTFTYNFEFYPDQFFGAMIDPHFYPLDYEVGAKIFMQIEATSSVNNTVLFVESCSASPYDNPNYQPTYPIIQNGCTLDRTVIIYPTSNDKQFRFSIDAFKFIGLHEQVYISCSVIVCEAGNPNTRCSRGCIPPHQRRRREAHIETGAHYISQGPLRLQSAPDSKSQGPNLNLAFIAGCLLAAVAMISGVMIHRFKRAAVGYQPLPTTEQ